MATEWINSDNLFVSGTVEDDGSASVTVGARFEHATAVLLAESMTDRTLLAEALRTAADKIDPRGPIPEKCENPWHKGSRLYATMSCSECPRR